MSDHDALMRAIIDDPGDDLPRLAYADWCDENGDPLRAEFIRVQIALAAMEERHRRDCVSTVKRGMESAALRRRESDLLGRWCVDWVSPYDRRWISGVAGQTVHLGDGHAVTFRRGFVAEVRCPLGAWRQDGVACVEAYPLERVELSDRDTNGAGPGSRWWSCANYDDSVEPEWWLPRAIFERLPYDAAANAYPQTNRSYPSEEAALDALSVACLEWARGQTERTAAGLTTASTSGV